MQYTFLVNFYGIRVFAENFSNCLFKYNYYESKINSRNKKSNKKKPVIHIKYARNRYLIYQDLKYWSWTWSAENVNVDGSPDSGNTFLKNLRLANVNRLMRAQLSIYSIRNKFESFIVDTFLQFVIFKSLSYCIEETIEFDLMASFCKESIVASNKTRWYYKRIF